MSLTRGGSGVSVSHLRVAPDGCSALSSIIVRETIDDGIRESLNAGTTILRGTHPSVAWTLLMRNMLAIACLLSLGLLDGVVFAQPSQVQQRSTSATPPADKSAEDIQSIDKRVADWLKTCLADWDRATHMTTSEWRTTCKRVAEERRKFLIETPDASSIGRLGRPR